MIGPAEMEAQARLARPAAMFDTSVCAGEEMDLMDLLMQIKSAV